jgi:hypothetical protein
MLSTMVYTLVHTLLCFVALAIWYPIQDYILGTYHDAGFLVSMLVIFGCGLYIDRRAVRKRAMGPERTWR